MPSNLNKVFFGPRGGVFPLAAVIAREGRDVAEGRARLAEALQQFVRMYNVHEAREDTVLFPAFRGIVSGHEYCAFGEEFEEREHELFGEKGFAATVDRVAAIEKTLGIYDLPQFTPTV